jgi:pilus assembly protein Flp/PilA
MMDRLVRSVRKFVKDESGQGMVEYGLIIGLVAIALVITITSLNGSLGAVFGNITASLNDAATP